VTLHTDIPTRSTVEQLLSARAVPCVSIYLATSPVTHEAQAARIELKNLAANAVAQLEEIEVDRGVVPDLRLPDVSAAEPPRQPGRGRRSVLRQAAPACRHTFPQAAFVLALAAGSVRLVEILPTARRTPSTCPGFPRTQRVPRARRRSPTAHRARGSRAARVRRSGCASSRGRSTRRCGACSPGSNSL
jgi:hypothetical protein